VVYFPEHKGACFSCALDNVWTLLGSFGIFSSPKKSTLLTVFDYFLLMR
jgi:hypothetical protein